MLKNLRIEVDAHTHTVMSGHAWSTIQENCAAAAQKGYVEKGNKDEVFRYHIAKVNEEDDSLQDIPELSNEDFVLGIRPEFLDIQAQGLQLF